MSEASIEIRRLLPEPGAATVDEAISGLALADRAPPDRPYLVLNMVTSADGRATVDGRTRELGNPADQAIFHHLRTQVDAVMMGAGTLRVERYGRILRDPALREKRAREGFDGEPVACVVSGRLNLPSHLPLLQDPHTRVVVLTGADAELEGVEADVSYVREEEGEDGLPLGRALGRLRSEHGIRSVLCEGGPHLNSFLLREGLVDELFLSHSPLLAGPAEDLTIVEGEPLEAPVDLELVWLYEHEGHLFARYRVCEESPSG